MARSSGGSARLEGIATGTIPWDDPNEGCLRPIIASTLPALLPAGERP